MSACRDQAESESGCSDDFGSHWSIVQSRRKQKFLLVFGVKDSITCTLVEFKIACGDLGLGWLVSRTVIRRFGNHMRILVKDRFAKVLRRIM